MNTMYRVLGNLYDHAHDHMTADELEALGSSLTEQAISIGQDMSGLLEGVACLVDAEDGAREAGLVVSGMFQTPHSVFQVLCLAASKFDMIAGMIEVGKEATYRANRLRNEATGVQS